MIGCIRRMVLAFVAGLWGVDQCDGCRRPITGEPYAGENSEFCAACWWSSEVDTESAL